MKKSEFGKGLTYTLGLVLVHSYRDIDPIIVSGITLSKSKKYKEDRKYSKWFVSVWEHMSGLIIPNNLPLDLQKKLRKLKRKVKNWELGNPQPTRMDIHWTMQECKECLYLIDKWYGIKAVQSEVEG